jgi:hypothetical protein
MLRRVTLVRTDVQEERSASIITVTRIGVLGTLAITSNVVPSSRFLSHWWWRRYVPPKRRFLQEPHGVTSQKTLELFISNTSQKIRINFINLFRYYSHECQVGVELFRNRLWRSIDLNRNRNTDGESTFFKEKKSWFFWQNQIFRLVVWHFK